MPEPRRLAEEQRFTSAVRMGKVGKALLKEIILENFMSYDYARIPIERGLNVVCGPNGSGKSSILLGLSVALGQAYTERSRRLSDLVRWGENLARVTLIFDNTAEKNRRPIPTSNSDDFMLSRYLRKDGIYWYEAEYHETTKAEVVKLLSDLGINPDNMLIIMHQNMVGEFSVVPSSQKLIMLEEAVGFHAYRQRILEAQERLTQVLSEESSVTALLTNAEQTLEYWKTQYVKYRQKVELLEKKNYLERELAWASAIKFDRNLESLHKELERRKNRLQALADELEEAAKDIDETRKSFTEHQMQKEETFFSILEYEKQKSACDTYLKVTSEISEKIKSFSSSFSKVPETFTLNSISKKDAALVETIKVKTEKILKWLADVNIKSSETAIKMDELENILSSLKAKMKSLNNRLDALQEKYANGKVKEAILKFQKSELEEKIVSLNEEIGNDEEELANQISAAEKVGEKVDTNRSIQEISEDLKVIGIQLSSSADISEDTEKMYKKYLKVYDELKQKSQIVSENKRRMLAEVEVRKQTWRKVLENFLKELAETYRSTLSAIGASGDTKLIDFEDIDTAGLEIKVGFHGSPLATLDSYTQSGGERTIAIMAFLLSLQKYVKSPIRAVDEFDVHMDPRNREVFSKLILSTVKAHSNVQYLMITPGQLPFFDEEIQVVMVQNAAGKSEVKKVSK